jgi:drug/metabolite transporter (DMT)-like permease
MHCGSHVYRTTLCGYTGKNVWWVFEMDRKLKADLSLMFCSLIWGATFVVVKTGLDHASPFVFLAVRFTIATALMALFRPKVIGRIQREEIFPGMRLAFFMFAGYCFQTAGLQYTTATNSGFVTGSSVVLVPLLLGIFWGRTLTKWIYAGAFAALVGLYFLTVPAGGAAFSEQRRCFNVHWRGFLRRTHHSGR